MSRFLSVFGFLMLMAVSMTGQPDGRTPESISRAGIRAMTTTTFQITSGGEIEKIKTERFEYNREGNLVRRVDYGSGNVPETSTRISYDSRGNKVSQELIRHKEKDTLHVEWQYKYEADQIVEMHNNNTDIYKTYTYDTEGRMIAETDIDAGGKMIASHTWIYDKAGLLTEEKEEQQFLIRTYTWQYDQKGRKTVLFFTRTHTFEGEVSTMEKETYEYDTAGRLAKTTRTGADGQIQAFSRMYYDPNGLLIKEETGDTEYIYKYDTKGNLTEKKKTIRGKVPGFVKNSYEFW
ncbi:MAG: hypothetical protein R3C61_20495 [Bacteroidia bacterium]